MKTWIRYSLPLALLLCLAIAPMGCSAVGLIASAIPKKVDAKYKGLAKQKIAVMVWASLGTRIDFPMLQKDTTTMIQSDLIAKNDEDELKETQFPWEPRSVVLFQKEHPELETQSAKEYASRISGITRLVYVEITDFSTRGSTAPQLLKGTMTGNVKVVEVENGKSKMGFELNGISIFFPPKSPEGTMDVPEDVIYRETIKSFAQSVAELFYTHPVEE